MSRFLPDDLFVGAEKERLSFVRRSRGFRPVVVATFSLALPSDFWERPDIELISRSLPAEILSGTQASIVVADRLVRYFLVERPLGARSAAEIELAAALRFEELYGDDARAWQIKMDLSPRVSNFLACGLPETYGVILQQLFASLRIPVQHISPFGVEQWNRHARRLRPFNICFIALSSDSAWMALRRNRRWLAAHVHGLRGDRNKELQDLIRREFARHGVQEQWGNQAIYISGAVDNWISSALTNARLLSTATLHGLDHLQADTFRLALSSVWPTCK